MGIVDAAYVAIGYGAVRPWVERWQDLEDAKQQVEVVCQVGTDISPDRARRAFLMFFRLCREAADHIEDETGLPAQAHVHADPALRICDALAQTTKHRTRDKKPGTKDPDPMTARISQVESTPNGERVTIAWNTWHGLTGTEDALALARRCALAWQRFFQLHGLNPAA
ncbi:hypothetical protein [Actinoplanes sp. NPDC026619]|uniref:hypothetical protein n=1 Tax=Actinoplanes sp. NPDC026619 TaxID=3155798 RepID=UPI0033E46772